MSELDSSRSTLTPDDALPRVEPPTAGFIVQLFIVPAVIVAVIVLVWVMFNWLAQMGSDPRDYLAQIEKQNANSWIAAHNLAEELRTKPALKQNSEVAAELARMLDDAVEAGQMSEDDIRLRVFLCRALGEFEVTDGVPALLKAAATQRQPAEADVRRSAIEAVALLASHAGGGTGSAATSASAPRLTHAKLLPTLLAASRDEEARVRESAAFALGVVGGSPSQARLVELLDDSAANVRFNAATGLARLGDPAASEVLVEMLDISDLDGVREEEGQQAQDFKRALIVINGLRAVRQLAQERPAEELAPLKTAVDELLELDLQKSFAQADYAAEVRAQALAVSEEFKGAPPAAAAQP